MDAFINAHYRLQDGFFSIGYFIAPTMTLKEGVHLHVDKLAMLASIKATDKVLDVGAGRGKSAQRLRDTISCDVTPIDIVPAPGVIEANKEDLPFPDNSFDVYWSTLAFSYGDEAKTLAEARRVLKPGGKIALTDVSSTGLGLPGVTEVVREDWTEHAIETYKRMRRMTDDREGQVALRMYFDDFRLGRQKFWCVVAI